MVYGRSGSGKSSTWASLAGWIADTDTDSHIHLGDSDNAYSAIRYDEIESVVTATHITDYREALEWARKTRENVKADDWVVFDRMDNAWDWAQEHYWGITEGDDDLMLADVVTEKSFEEVAGPHGTNWGKIYKYYHGLVNTVLNMPCHILGVASAKEIRADTKAAIVAQYKDVGFYPSGPPEGNAMVHNFHSVLFCAETPRDWRYTSIKEMGPINKPKRRMMKGEVVEDFVVTYLMKVGGWRL